MSAAHREKDLRVGTPRRQHHALAETEVTTGGRLRPPQSRGRALKDHPSPSMPGAGAEIDGVIRSRRRDTVVLNVDHRAAQLPESGQQARHIRRMLPDGGLIQHVHDILQAARQRNR